MWELINRTPFATERCWVRDLNGAEVWLVAIKGTFEIGERGALSVASDQEAVNIAPKMRADSQSSSLESDTDLPHQKIATDVLVEGHAYAPDNKKTTTMTVGLRTANIKKSVFITGDRIWKNTVSGITPSEPKPFLRMPLIYERAFGGIDQQSEQPEKHGWEARNPAGCGFATVAENVLHKPLPNIENPSSRIRHWNDRPQPIGLGPIAGHWSPRVELAGTYDDEWAMNRQPLLAADFDIRYYQCAPSDQQVPGFLKGGELVEVFNMTPNGHLKFYLPRTSFTISTLFGNGTSVAHLPVLHTVTVKPDYPKVMLVWHMHHECHHLVHELISTTVRLKKRIRHTSHNETEMVPA